MQPLRLFLVSVLMTAVTTVILGVGYPLAVTALAQALFPRQANGLDVDGRHVGGELIGQPFASAGYFWSRPVGRRPRLRRGRVGRVEPRTDQPSAGRSRAGRTWRGCRPPIPARRCPSTSSPRRPPGSTPTSRRPRRRSRCRALPGSGDSTARVVDATGLGAYRGAAVRAGWENRACTSCDSIVRSTHARPDRRPPGDTSPERRLESRLPIRRRTGTRPTARSGCSAGARGRPRSSCGAPLPARGGAPAG